MAKTSIRMIPTMTPVITLVGEPIRAAGFYGHTAGNHTIAIKTSNLQGRVMIQGSLAVSPTEVDWFTLPLGGEPYIQFPRLGAKLVGWIRGESVTVGYQIQCNALWLRAVVDRSYLIPDTATEYQIAPFGIVDSILLNF